MQEIKAHLKGCKFFLSTVQLSVPVNMFMLRCWEVEEPQGSLIGPCHSCTFLLSPNSLGEQSPAHHWGRGLLQLLDFLSNLPSRFHISYFLLPCVIIFALIFFSCFWLCVIILDPQLCDLLLKFSVGSQSFQPIYKCL